MSEGNGKLSAGRDDGSDRDNRPPRPCLKRITFADGRYGFCNLPDGHERQRDEAGGQTHPVCSSDAMSAPPPASSFTPKRR